MMNREKAKNILTSILHTNGAYMDYLDSEDVEAIRFLANDERPHGVWIYHKEWEWDGECAFECSRCGMGSDVDYDFCPNCGADMRPKEGEAK